MQGSTIALRTRPRRLAELSLDVGPNGKSCKVRSIFKYVVQKAHCALWEVVRSWFLTKYRFEILRARPRPHRVIQILREVSKYLPHGCS
eukprot:3860629-Pleurochrysis_carterae.AAC.1